MGGFLLVFAVQQVLDLVALCNAQPFGIGGAVVEVPIGPDANRGGHQAFHREQPLPAMQPGEPSSSSNRPDSGLPKMKARGAPK